MNLIGKIIGNRYEILEEAGNGGMATVYKAKDHVLNRMVAVKVLKDEFTTDADFIKRFNTEAQSAAGLSHANIVSIYDVGHEEENNLYYIVMELVKGKTLKEIINKDGPLSWKWAVNIAMQIASALEVAHKNGIIHRDIKPHNIIITEDGVAKVTDFGIAKAVSNSTITAFGTTIGSVHYFSPEQAKGGITDAKSDLYSLGVVMYEMLTGKVPFDADTPVSVALKHMQEDPVPPIEVNPEIPQAVNDIVMKAMQKNPVNRYQSATEMLVDLRKALKDPDGNFVIIENKDGGYTRIMPAVNVDDYESQSANSRKGKKENKIQAFFKKHPRAKVPCLVLGLVVLFIIVFLTTKFILDGGSSGNKVVVPDVVGKTEEEATTILESAELKKGTVDTEASSTVEEGKIISQNPEAKDNNKVDKGTAVNLIISTGPETTELPNFVGENIDEVREKAKKMGITLNEIQENSDSVKENAVISQDTKAGVLVKSGDTVTVHVSTGVEKTNVPTVVGVDEGTAKVMLSNAKLKANITYTNDPTKDNGKVISQSIEQGKEVAVNTTIDLTINKIEESKASLKLSLTIPSSMRVDNSSKSSDDSNTTSSTQAKQTTMSVPITVTVNGNRQITTTITVDLTKSSQDFTLGEIHGTDSQTIVVDGTVNGSSKTLGTTTKNIDDYKGNIILVNGSL